MKSLVKFFLVALTVIFTLGFFFTPKTYAGYPPNSTVVVVYENGVKVTYVYSADGGIIEVFKGEVLD
jgi:hypothetical protein